MRLSAIANYVPIIRITSAEKAVENLKKVALPAMALVAASMINGAQAIGYVECINSCNGHPDAHPVAKLACYALCLIFAKN